ncbi:polysaccharide pyruvyl transferase family protein [Derxia gummosa]|uniref:Polysaccharide pyruvyl transferase family protein n=1 Tax=Derxia gummosa DSM 723 TaxID=1121388 RepID=A0A8B6X4Y1_9BURK|nr:polysaccharide pyruvyl transferase family protein [Derxia gummosa]
MKLYLAGQNNFGNRGCEALVRSTTWMLRQRMGNDVKVVCPSFRPDLDGPQWPDAKANGIEFTQAPVLPDGLVWWWRAGKILPFLRNSKPPLFDTDANSRARVAESDAVIMTGGDVISLDYGLVSLYEWSGFIENAARQGKKTVLWAASVGPFKANAAVEKIMVDHLNAYDAITVRETETLAYLRGIGVNKSVLVADPAFNLQPQAVDFEKYLPPGDQPVLGLNVSPLIRKFRPTPEAVESLDADVVRFIEKLVDEGKYRVLLVPHVDPLDGVAENSDSHYMRGLKARLGDKANKVGMLPPTFNASQLKHVISKLAGFIGARTHATIAAMSMGVPCISIAYSVKAKGLNKDLFGNTRYVLETPKVSLATLCDAVALLEQDDAVIRACLADRIPVWRKNAFGSIDALQQVLAVTA